MIGDIHDYLPANRKLARKLVGQQLRTVERLMYEPPDESEDESPRFAWGPVLLTGTGGEEWLIDAEESKANVLLLENLRSAGPWYTSRPLKIPIVTDDTKDPLRFLLTEIIESVDVVSRQPEPGVHDSFAMCGLRLTTTSGAMVNIGTHLGGDAYPEVAFRLPREVGEGLKYTRLRNDM